MHIGISMLPLLWWERWSQAILSVIAFEDKDSTVELFWLTVFA
jgi:hypothetical protein